MTTTDANGIVFLQDTDDISPFHTLINGLQTATSTAIGELASRGLMASVSGPSSQQDYSGESAAVETPSISVIAGHSYLVSATVAGTKITNAGLARARFSGTGTGLSTANFMTGRYNANDPVAGSGTYIYQPASSGSVVFRIICAADTAAFRVPANGALLSVIDVT